MNKGRSISGVFGLLASIPLDGLIVGKYEESKRSIIQDYFMSTKPENLPGLLTHLYRLQGKCPNNRSIFHRNSVIFHFKKKLYHHCEEKIILTNIFLLKRLQRTRPHQTAPDFSKQLSITTY